MIGKLFSKIDSKGGKQSSCKEKMIVDQKNMRHRFVSKSPFFLGGGLGLIMKGHDLFAIHHYIHLSQYILCRNVSRLIYPVVGFAFNLTI